MIRNYFFGSMTALCLLALGACGDDKGGSDTNVAPTDPTTDTTNATTDTTDPTNATNETTEGTSETTVSPTTSELPTTGEPEVTTGPEPTTETTVEPETTDSSTTEEPGTTTEMTDPGTTGDPELQECLGQVEPNDPCGVCACTECLDELQACEANPGCKAIRDCGQMAGCTGVDCLGPCGGVINMNGGVFGQPAQLAQAIGNCVASQCKNEC
jgi:hypothetical protein